MATSRGGRRAQQQQLEMQSLTSRESLDRKYKPIFDGYAEDGGIPLQILREKLQSRDTEDLPQDKLDALLQGADADRGGILNYEEFVKLIITAESQDVAMQTLTKFQLLLKTAVLVVPRKRTDTYVDHYNCCPPPLFMITISIVELAIFIGYAIVQKGKGIPTTRTSGAPLESPLVYNPYRRYEAWRFLSYIFIHNGIKHIMNSLLFLLVIGIPLEMVHNFWRVGIVFFLGVIAGSLCTSVLDPWTFLVGASGGCYALLGAHFASIIMNWKEMTVNWKSSIKNFLSSAPVRLAFWTIYGLLIGIPLVKNIDEEHWEKKLWWIALVVCLVLVIFAVYWNGFYPNYYPPTDWRPCCP